MKKLLICIISLVLFTSCYTTWTTVGNYKQLEQQGLKTYQYDKSKQYYLFGGLIPLGHAHANTPNEPCEIRSKFKFGDFLLTTITCDIFCSRTVYVYAFEGGSAYPLQEPMPSAPKVKESSEPTNDVVVVDKKAEPEKVEKKSKKQEPQIEQPIAAESSQEPVVQEEKKQATKTTKKDKKEETPIVVNDAPQSEPVQSEPVQPVLVPAKEPQSTPIAEEPLNPIVEEPIVVDEPTMPEPQVASSAVNIENGAVIAPFTVGSSKKVYFSKGNLQYQASSKTWRFAEQQYDAIGADNTNISRSNSGWIDLFGWGTSGWYNRNTFYMPYDTESASATYGYGYGPTDGQTYEYSLRGKFAEADWGVANVISEAGDSAGMWRTLTRAEWGYMLLKRPNASNLYSLAIVNGVKGLLILPDDWTCPGGINFIARTSFELNNYTLEQWKKLEAHGAIFLPSAGCRYGTTVGNVGTTGSYWTASASGGENAWYFVFNKGKIDIVSDFSRALGRSVRLVQDIR